MCVLSCTARRKPTRSLTPSSPLADYAGLHSPQSVRVRQEEGASTLVQLDANDTVTVSLTLPPLSITWVVVEAA